MKLLAVVTPPTIYHSWPTRKKFREVKFTPANMKSCGHLNVKKHKEIKNAEQYIALDIYSELDGLDNR